VVAVLQRLQIRGRHLGERHDCLGKELRRQQLAVSTRDRQDSQSSSGGAGCGHVKTRNANCMSSRPSDGRHLLLSSCVETCLLQATDKGSRERSQDREYSSDLVTAQTLQIPRARDSS
jgi:hypothetical protein